MIMRCYLTAHPTTDLQEFIDSWSLDDTCVSDEQIDFCGFLTAEQLTVRVLLR